MPDKPPAGLLGPLRSALATDSSALVARARQMLAGQGDVAAELREAATRVLGAERMQLIDDRVADVPGSHRREVAQQHDDVAAMFAAGDSIASIARATGYTRKYVRRLLRERGLLS